MAESDEFEAEMLEWRESLDFVIDHQSPERARDVLKALQGHAFRRGIRPEFSANTPYINTIPPAAEAPFPGDRDSEKRLRSTVRWNAMAMVVRANRREAGIGGHISTYASAATLYEVGFNHFFRAPVGGFEGDQIYFQGHASPGIYARAFLEGRLSQEKLENFRLELHPDGGLSSYPHPRLMPDFWQFPTVSMGLGPITAIYQARFNRYLEDRNLKPRSTAKVWAFLGDGETDEPETLGAITLAAREHLDNLIFVINCNLQRLDGPVRGNGKIIQELEAAFRGAGWNVIKVIWGGDWDALLAHDTTGLLVKRMGEVVDGEYQKYTVAGGAYIRKHFFGKYPELLQMVEHMTDDQLSKLNRGGHDIKKVYAAYHAAVDHQGGPTVILAKTIKGYGLGEAGEGRNVTHQQKKISEDELRNFRTRFGIPISDEAIAGMPFYKPAETSREIAYLKERRAELGGYLPARSERSAKLTPPDGELFEEFAQGTGKREVSTTMVAVRVLTKLLQHQEIGKLIVPIVPDEARTFGMEALFRQFGIYAHTGQLYEPVDRDSLLYYKESKDGQILEEGITEAGAMSSFIAAGTAYATHGINTIPFFIFYSMFGLQRIGDLVWSAADQRTRGFLLGGTAGRTTLGGEGLQHQDGHSHLLALAVPNLMAYDPAFAYEIAVIIKDGIRRMYGDKEAVFYYITLQNENYAQPPMPKGVEEGILKGMYLYKKADGKAGLSVDLLGSGSILSEALKAQKILGDEYGVAADVWSVTSYKELRRDALECDRLNLLHPGAKPAIPYVTECLKRASGVCVAVSDYVKALPDLVGRWVPGRLLALGTDGFGRSETRAALRDFFEIDARYVTIAALYGLAQEGKLSFDAVKQAMKDLKINVGKVDPMAI